MLTFTRVSLAALFASLAAQPVQVGRPSRESSIRLDVNLVLVPVNVTDRRGATVTGLARDQFRIFEDKVQQNIVSFSREESPVSVGVIFDLSGSMKSKIREALSSSAALFKTATDADEAFLITFAGKPESPTSFTSDFSEIQMGLARSKVHGSTALVDAVYLGLNRMRKAHNARKALVVISDGMDNHSRYTKAELRAQAVESDVQIYTIGIFDPARNQKAIQMDEERSGLALLDDLSHATGGLHFRINGTSDIPRVAERIGVAMHNVYLLGYYPPDRGERFRKIQVKATVPNVRLSTRSGYYAAPTGSLPARNERVLRP